MKFKILFFLFMGLGFAMNASAQATKSNTASTQAAINQALKSGKLTPQQTAQLKARSAALQKGKNINKALTPAEKAKLQALAKQRNNAAKK